MHTIRSLGTLGVFIASSALAAGFAHDANFMVFTPADPSQEAGQALAEQVLAQAETYRAEIAREWLSEELPPGVGRTVINVDFSGAQDSGLTWAKDHPDRKFHNVYLRVLPGNALGGNLRHEMAHVVLATRFPHPHRLPAWIEEGIASRYDDPQRVATRKRTVRWYVQTGNLPPISQVLDARGISADDQAAYAIAASLTDYLVSLAGKKVFLKFAQTSAQQGVEAALRKHFAINSVRDLQAKWQDRLSQTNRVALRFTDR